MGSQAAKPAEPPAPAPAAAAEAAELTARERRARERSALNPLLSIHDALRQTRRPGREEDRLDRGRANYGRAAPKPLLPESLRPNDYFSNSLRMDTQLTTGDRESFHYTLLPGQPHYSKIEYPVDFRDSEAVGSRFKGQRPWRCDDRIYDFVGSMWSLRFVSPMIPIRCVRSVPGEEPDVPYTSLSRHQVEFYAERKQRGNIRKRFIESYPFVEPTDPFPAKGPLPVIPEVPL